MGKIKVDLDAALAPNTSYYVTVDEGFAVDANTGEPSPAITDQSAITFTGSDVFETTEFVPNDNETGFRFKTRSQTRRIDITFEQDVLKGSGPIELYDNTHTLVETFDVASDVYFRFSPPDAPNTTGTRVTIYATDWFDYTKTYYLLIDDGAFLDATGCMTCRVLIATTSNGDATANFYYQPEYGYGHSVMGEKISANPGQITLEYCKPVILRTGNFYLYDSDDNLIETIPASRSPNYVGNQSTYPNYVDDGSELENRVVHLFPMYKLDEFTDYYITSDRGVVGDTHGFSYGPLVKGDTNVIQKVYKPYITGKLVIQFNRDVKDSADYPAAGKVYLRRQADDVTVRTWDVKWNEDWIGSANPYAREQELPTVTEDNIIEYVDNRAFLTADLAQNVEYYVLFDTGSFKDLDKIPVDGITVASEWDFETFDLDTISGTQTSDYNHYVELNFNEHDVTALSQTNNNFLTPYVPTTSRIKVFDDNDVLLHTIDTENVYSNSMFAVNQYDFSNNYYFDHGVVNQYTLNGYVLVEKEMFVTDDGFRHIGNTDTSLMPLTIPSCIVDTWPAHQSFTGAVSVAYDNRIEVGYPAGRYTGITIQFDRAININENGRIRLKRYDNDQDVEVFDSTQVELLQSDAYDDTESDVYIEGNNSGGDTIWFQVGFDSLDELTKYYIVIESSFIDILHPDTSIVFSGIDDKDVYNFTVDSLNLIRTWPADGDIQVIEHNAAPYEMQFNEDIVINTPGNIYLKRYSDDATIETFSSATDITIVGADDSVPWTSIVQFTGSIILDPGERYYFTIDPNLFSGKYTGFNYSGISDKNQWDFTTFIENVTTTVVADGTRVRVFDATLSSLASTTAAVNVIEGDILDFDATLSSVASTTAAVTVIEGSILNVDATLSSSASTTALVTHIEGVILNVDSFGDLTANVGVVLNAEADITASFTTVENGLVETGASMSSAFATSCIPFYIKPSGNITITGNSALTATADVIDGTIPLFVANPWSNLTPSALFETTDSYARSLVINDLPDGWNDIGGPNSDNWTLEYIFSTEELDHTDRATILYDFNNGSNFYVYVERTSLVTDPTYRVIVEVDGDEITSSFDNRFIPDQYTALALVFDKSDQHIRVYIDGELDVTLENVDFTLSDGLRIGNLEQDAGVVPNYRMKIDEFRISKIARYFNNYTVPFGTRFTTDTDTQVLYHFDYNFDNDA